MEAEDGIAEDQHVRNDENDSAVKQPQENTNVAALEKLEIDASEHTTNSLEPKTSSDTPVQRPIKREFGVSSQKMNAHELQLTAWCHHKHSLECF